MDGPEIIHDKLRVNLIQLGTHKKIKINIKKLKRIGIIPEFECTYTASHLKLGITIKDLIDYFCDEFQCTALHCPIVIANPKSEFYLSLSTVLKLYADAIEYSALNVNNGNYKSFSVFSRLLSNVTKGIPISNYCPAGITSIAINADGNIFSCFMLMNKLEYSYGNVNNTFMNLKVPDSIQKILEHSNKWLNPECCKCWAQELCFGCIGEDIVRTENKLRRSAIAGNSQSCDFKRNLIELFLTMIADLSLGSN